MVVSRRRNIITALISLLVLIFLVFVSESNFSPKQRNWFDEKLAEAEKERRGIGEHGKEVKLDDSVEIALNEKLYEETGFSVVVSNKISVNRSVPDLVYSSCKKIEYFANLPRVSVIVIFHNEVKSVLLRTVHGIFNRTPAELLHEIILVNDCSTKDELYEPLQNYVKFNFHGKVKVKNLSKRSGLIVARMEGARMATGEVLVFFDSHVEVQQNWLPPLLHPIVENRRIATLPIVDYFDAETFSFYEGQEYGQGEQSIAVL